ncbi:MAG: DUF1161 domain-containing protein [Rhodanobacter sp.]|jgi:hypothetical protein|nr:DUF1161 domain-containing protein [Rhodanobacter sp.]
MKALKVLTAVAGLLVLSGNAFAAKSCDELKSKIRAKMEAHHVSGYSLDIVDKGSGAADKKVVGTCAGNSKEIVYSRQSANSGSSKKEHTSGSSKKKHASGSSKKKHTTGSSKKKHPSSSSKKKH